MSKFYQYTTKNLKPLYPGDLSRDITLIDRHHGFSSRRGLTFWLQWSISITTVITLLLCLALFEAGEVTMPYRILALFTLLGSVPVYSIMKVYHKNHHYLSGLGRLLGAWLILLSGLIVMAYITQTIQMFSRKLTITWAVSAIIIQALIYITLHTLSLRYQEKLKNERISIIIGNNELAQSLAEKLVRYRNEPLIGLVSADDEYSSPNNGLYPTIGNISHLRELVKEHKIRRLYIALPAHETDKVEHLYVDLLDANIDVIWIPDLQSMLLLNHSVNSIEGMPAIYLNESPLTAYPAGALIKSLMDRSVALLCIILLSPILITTAFAVKISSSGPIIFKQKRHGWNGKIIRVWKFRSMRIHNDEEVKQATRQDPRITNVGKFIRRTSIDELPQLFNVLRGEMSLVGPRPHAVAHNNYYTDKIIAYMARHRVKPGITGLAQISGCRGETETIEKMAERIKYDLEYINQWSIWLDIKILIRTPFTLLSKDIY